jgi:hypothetical protein
MPKSKKSSRPVAATVAAENAEVTANAAVAAAQREEARRKAASAAERIAAVAAARREEARREAAFVTERFAAEAAAAKTTASLRLAAASAAASATTFGFLNSIVEHKTLSVIQLAGEPDIPRNNPEYESVAEGGPVDKYDIAADIYTKEYPYETIKDSIRLAPDLFEAAQATDRELLKRDYPEQRKTMLDAISWIVAYQSRPQAPPDKVNYKGNMPETHSSILIRLPEGKLYSLGITVTDKTNWGGTPHLHSPDHMTVNLKPYIHIVFPFTTYFYRGIEEFLNRNADSVKMYYKQRAIYNAKGVSHNVETNMQFFNVTLNRTFTLPGISIPFLYESLNCARGVQEILKNAISVGVVAHPDTMYYRYGPFRGAPMPPDWSEFIYELLFGTRHSEKDICFKYPEFCDIILKSMPHLPSIKGGRRTRRRRHKLKKN